VRSVPAPRRPISGATVSTTLPLHRLRALPDHRWLDSLLRSRAWIWIMGIGLGGIVFMQVSLLKMNAGISRAVESAATLDRSNAALEGQVAELSSGDRIRTLAAGLGLFAPSAGSVAYLHARPGVDASRAARNMTAPSAQAREVVASDGRSAATATTPAGTTTTAAPVATATPAPVATATPAPTTSPPTAPTGAATGAAAAPSGQG
jgi:hypothetical protein